MSGKRPGLSVPSEMMEMMSDGMRFHQRQRNTTKDGTLKVRYSPRKMEDRKKVGPTDTKGRPQTDLLRETIDLRPDHSRVLQYLAEAGRTADLMPVLAEIQAEEIRLFEEIHPGRRIKSEGEHTDSGQYHFDHWHTGIEKVVVDDQGAIVADDVNGEEILASGEKMEIRMRHVFRNFGVGDGMASFDRHRSALEDSGRDAKLIMGYTLGRLVGNAESAEKQNGEYPRDLRLWRAIDQFVDRKLRGLDPALCDKARLQYVDWIEAGYDLGKLGINEETAEQSKHKRRKKELEDLRAAMSGDTLKVADRFNELHEKVHEMEQSAAKQKKELQGLRLLADLVRQFLDRLVSAKKMDAMLAAVGAKARKILGLIGKEVGREIPLIDKDAPTK